MAVEIVCDQCKDALSEGDSLYCQNCWDKLTQERDDLQEERDSLLAEAKSNDKRIEELEDEITQLREANQ